MEYSTVRKLLCPLSISTFKFFIYSAQVRCGKTCFFIFTYQFPLHFLSALMRVCIVYQPVWSVPVAGGPGGRTPHRGGLPATRAHPPQDRGHPQPWLGLCRRQVRSGLWLKIRQNVPYAIIGAMPAVAQTISYEVRLAIMFFYFLHAIYAQFMRWNLLYY